MKTGLTDHSLPIPDVVGFQATQHLQGREIIISQVEEIQDRGDSEAGRGLM